MGQNCMERLFIIMLIISCVNADCKEGQKQRIDHHGNQICCKTTICKESQQFILCSIDEDNDRCVTCPSGQFTRDVINTKDWTEQISICVEMPMCSMVDAIMVDGECVCNKFKGYYGHDINNCRLDTKNCKDSGHELNDDGFCVECPVEFYKSEDNAYGVCKRKTQCARHQVEVHPGSSKHDRTCRKRTSKDPPPPTPPPTTDQTDQGTNSTKLDVDGKGLSMMYIWLIGVTGSSLLILTGAAVLIYVFRKKWCCAAFLKLFKVGRRYAPVASVETGSDRGRSTNRSSRDEDHELTSITNIDSSLDSSKSSSNSSKEQEQTCSKYRITEVIVEMDENETGVKTLALEPKSGEETVVKSLPDDLDRTGIHKDDPDSTSLKARYDEKDYGKGQMSFDVETTATKSLLAETPDRTVTQEDSEMSIVKVKRNLQKEGANDCVSKVKKNMSADDKDLSITKVKRLNESENKAKKLTESESKTPKSSHKSFLTKYRKGQSIDLHWPKFRKKTTDETSFSLPSTPKKSNMFGATAKESDRPTLKVEPFSRRSSPRNSKLECAGAMASPERDDSFRTLPTGESYPFQTIPTGESYPMFSDSMGESNTLYSDSTGFYSCDDEVIFGEASGAPQFPQRSNRVTLPANVFVIEGESGTDGNGRVRSLPIISQEESESDSSSFWQQLVLHGLESSDRSPDEGHRSQDEGHNIIYPSVHLSLRQNAIPYTSQNDDVNPSAGRSDLNDDVLGASQAVAITPGHQISIDPLSTLDANSIMNEVQVSIPHTNPLISIPRPHEVLPPPEPTFDETIMAGPSSSSSEEAVSEGASSEGAASEGAASEGATSEGSGASVLMPLMEIREEGSTSTGSGSSRKRTLSRSLSMEEENKDSSSSTEKSMG